MKLKKEAATDIATIGIWDADLDKINQNQSYKDWSKTIETDAANGDLLYIDTGADGSYSVCIVDTKEELEKFTLNHYCKVEKEFYLFSKSGKLMIGGLEDYRSDKPATTNEDDIFLIKPNPYRVFPYVLRLKEEEMACAIESIVGAEEWAYYQKKSVGCSLVCGLFLVGLLAAFFLHWSLLILALMLMVTSVILRNNWNSKDARLKKVEHCIEDFQQQHPDLLLRLEACKTLGKSKGSFHLDF